VYEGANHVGTIVTREAEFNDQDIALLLAHREIRADMGSHGIPLSEALDPKNQFAFTTGRVMDWAEKARLDAIDQFRKDFPDADMHGLFFPVRRRDQ
jgi:hypothetical protein